MISQNQGVVLYVRINKEWRFFMTQTKDFFEILGQLESSGDYAARNKFGYLGKYQMGEAAMIDAGYYTKNNNNWNNDWSGKFTGKGGVNSVDDFLNNAEAQEQAQRIFKKRQWQYLKSGGVENYINKTIKGETITPAMILGAAHLKGHGDALKYLKSNGKINPPDGFGTTMEDYMKHFKGCDVSEITGS